MQRFKLSQQGKRNQRWHQARRTMLEFSRSLTLIADPVALMASVAARVEELFGADRMIILRSPAQSDTLTVAFSENYSAEEVSNISVSRRDKLAKWLLVNETALILGNKTSVFDYLGEAEREMLKRLDARVCLPLLALNRLTGLMILSSTQKEWELDQEDIDLMQMVMTQASIAFENAHLLDEQRARLHKLYRAEKLAAAGQLAASVAHEIRNPLTAIRSTVQYLIKGFEEQSPMRPLIEGVIEEVDRINRTVDGLLSLTRREEVKAEKIDLYQLVEQSLLFLQTQARSQSVEIVWPAPVSDLCVIGDDSQFKQLLLNLMLNALQAMPQGGQLKLDLAGQSQEQGAGNGDRKAELSITDTGCGIPTKNLDKILDPFFTTKQGGTGLGLATSYAIVRQHGGEMIIESREGEGTTVCLRFPLAR